jgi:cell division protease FtsH
MLNLTFAKANNFIAFLMGGRCAEELVFGEMTNGASNDIEKATSLAHSMVCDWGMSKKLGPINLKKASANPFSPPGIGPNSDYSEQTAQSIDQEITTLVNDNYEVALKILKDNRDSLDRLAEGLIVWETLDFSQVEKLVKGEDIGIPIVQKGKKKSGGDQPKAKDENISPKVDNPGDDPLPA